MASTPPLRIISVHEPPPAPRFGPAHDDFKPRYPTRSSQRIASREARTTPEPQVGSRAPLSATTPESRRSTTQRSRHNLSPPISPQNSPKHNSARRVQVLSPSSPGTRTRSHATSSSNPSFTSSQNQSFPSSSTVMSDGMPPTPVKTPRKKIVPNINAAARALFQELPDASNEIMPTPKKNRKSTRHSGLSLGSLPMEGGVGPGHVEIFTDSRDNVPELDLSEANPFIDHPSEGAVPPVKGAGRTAKRGKLSVERKSDPLVDEAIKNDEGIVYVFRGKKVFKRFDDRSDEEEITIDLDDLGLLEHTEANVEAIKLIQPLTRRSVRPRRLFQTVEQKRAREAEKAEEEVTDIDEDTSIAIAELPVTASDPSNNNRRSRRITATKSAQNPIWQALDETEGRKAEGAGGGGGSPADGKLKKSKRGSPFESWKRVKPGTSASAAGPSNGRKRASSALEEGEQTGGGKRLRSR